MDIWENRQFGTNGQISIWWREVWGNVLRCRDWERCGDVCWGVGAGERKCEWRCVELSGGGEEKCREVC